MKTCAIPGSTIPRHGLTIDEMIGKRADELQPAEEVAELVEFERSVLESGKGARRLSAYQHPKEHLSLTSAPSLSAPDGEIGGLTVAAFDLTETQRMQERLEYQAQLLENVHDAIIATDLDLRITSWNKSRREAVRLEGRGSHWEAGPRGNADRSKPGRARYRYR
jgi:PAS domain-containing protein